MSTTNGKRQPSRHLRGYGSTHDARRRQVKPLVEAGNAVCSRCGNPISPREQWHLDHTDDRQGYLGVAHAYCNLRAAGIKTAKLHDETQPPAPHASGSKRLGQAGFSGSDRSVAGFAPTLGSTGQRKGTRTRSRHPCADRAVLSPAAASATPRAKP